MNRIAHSAVFRQARTIALYWSLPDELSTHASVRIWSLSKRIVLPVVEGSEMRFYPYDPTQPLSPGAFDIPCPTVTEECPPETIDLMILPGTAFDIFYGRLGRGKGFYDRYLSQPEASRIFKAGVCFDCQLEKELPREDHDRKMDAIFTPNRLLIQGE